MKFDDFDVELYLCDPNKNVECRKSFCFVHGGECYLTTKQQYSISEREWLKIKTIKDGGLYDSE